MSKYFSARFLEAYFRLTGAAICYPLARRYLDAVLDGEIKADLEKLPEETRLHLLDAASRPLRTFRLIISDMINHERVEHAVERYSAIFKTFSSYRNAIDDHIDAKVSVFFTNETLGQYGFGAEGALSLEALDKMLSVPQEFSFKQRKAMFSHLTNAFFDYVGAPRRKINFNYGGDITGSNKGAVISRRGKLQLNAGFFLDLLHFESASKTLFHEIGHALSVFTKSYQSERAKALGQTVDKIFKIENKMIFARGLSGRLYDECFEETVGESAGNAANCALVDRRIRYDGGTFWQLARS
ncbi:MAG: hypothetical protein HY053_05420 [Proteobacteria bacterium]|nr:hypothetical protein [Pseudomonadota bacterium]